MSKNKVDKFEEENLTEVDATEQSPIQDSTESPARSEAKIFDLKGAKETPKKIFTL